MLTEVSIHSRSISGVLLDPDFRQDDDGREGSGPAWGSIPRARESL